MNLRDYIDENGKCVIPEGVTEIEDDAFQGCTNLKEVTIPKSVRVITSFRVDWYIIPQKRVGEISGKYIYSYQQGEAALCGRKH